MTTSYPEKLAKLIADVENLTDPMERTELLVEYADRFHEVPPEIATRPFPEENRVRYCESEAYVWVEPQEDQTLKFYFAVENPQGISAKALAGILDETLSGAPPEQIAQVSPDIVFKIFGQNISMGKGQGLVGLVSRVQAIAKKFISR